MNRCLHCDRPLTMGDADEVCQGCHTHWLVSSIRPSLWSRVRQLLLHLVRGGRR